MTRNRGPCSNSHSLTVDTGHTHTQVYKLPIYRQVGPHGQVNLERGRHDVEVVARLAAIYARVTQLVKICATGQNFWRSLWYGFMPFLKSRYDQLVLIFPKPHSTAIRAADIVLLKRASCAR